MLTSKKVVEQVIDVGRTRYVTGGPHLWVSKLLYQKGIISSRKIWDEFVKDAAVDKDLIKSKHFLKERILYNMWIQGKITKGRSIDVPQFSKSGWVLVPGRAFKNVAPEILAQLQPLPKLNRQDYKEYLRQNNIPYDF